MGRREAEALVGFRFAFSVALLMPIASRKRSEERERERGSDGSAISERALDGGAMLMHG